ncbi:MAG: hypothetical protein WBA46_15215 [Thermomicrobiales bacterium]
MDRDTARSSLTAAVIAVIVWVVMGLLFMDDRGTVALWAVIFAIGTFVITYAIATAIGRAKR